MRYLLEDSCHSCFNWLFSIWNIISYTYGFCTCIELAPTYILVLIFGYHAVLHFQITVLLINVQVVTTTHVKIISVPTIHMYVYSIICLAALSL